MKKDFSKKFETVDIDGVRINFGDGWGLVRPSNTTPVIVTRFEAKSEKRLKEIHDQVMERVEAVKKENE